MSTQTWILVGLGVAGFVWYEKQKQAIPLAANQAITKVTNQAGASAAKLIDQGASALGSFLNRIGSGSSTPSSGAGSSCDSCYSSSSVFSPDSYVNDGISDGGT